MFVMTGLASVLAYFLRIYLARNLSVADYGLFWSTITFMMFLLIFREIGLNNAQTKFIAEYYGKKDYSKVKTIFISSFIFKFLSSALLISFFFFGARLLSVYYFKSPLSYFILVNLSVYIILSMLANHFYSVLNGLQQVKWYSWEETIRLGATIIFSFLFFKVGWGIMAPVFGFIMGIITACIMMVVGSLKYSFILRYPIKDFWKTTKELFTFGIPVIFTGVGGKIISHFDVLVLTGLVSLAQVGVYNAILPTALLFLFFPRAITAILFPMISELWGKKDFRKISEGMSFIYTYSFVMIIPAIVPIFIFSEFFITTLFGADYAAGVLPFRILLIGVLMYIITAINNAAISGIGRPKVVTKIVLLSALINLTFNLILIPFLGIIGAAIATSASYILSMILSTRWLIRNIKLKSPWSGWVKLMVIAIIFSIVVYSLEFLLNTYPLLEIMISTIVALLVYIFLMFKLKIITADNLKIIIKRVLN